MRETRELEFKECVSNSFLKTVSAFANYAGGSVLFGVDDVGHAVGIEDPIAASLSIENKINDTITPQPDYEIEIHEADSVVELRVHPGLARPYLCKSKAYKRNDSSTVEVDRIEFTRLVLEGKNLSFEQLPNGKQDLTFSCLESKLKDKANIETFGTDTLRTLNLMSDVSGYNIAAAILADHNDLPGIDMAQFGESTSVILRREIAQGESILQEIDVAMSFFEDIYCHEVVSGFARETVERIPREAFREAVTNAVAHRLWDVSAHVQVAMFSDRVTVSSPGGLPTGITEKEYLCDMVSVRRNPILANVFYRLGMIEAFGTGILRIKGLYKQSATKPRFSVGENTIIVELPLLRPDAGLTADQQAVFDVLSRVRPMAIGEILEHVDFSRSKLGRILKALVDSNQVETVSSGRGTKYKRP